MGTVPPTTEPAPAPASASAFVPVAVAVVAAAAFWRSSTAASPRLWSAPPALVDGAGVAVRLQRSHAGTHHGDVKCHIFPLEHGRGVVDARGGGQVEQYMA